MSIKAQVYSRKQQQQQQQKHRHTSLQQLLFPFPDLHFLRLSPFFFASFKHPTWSRPTLPHAHTSARMHARTRWHTCMAMTYSKGRIACPFVAIATVVQCKGHWTLTFVVPGSIPRRGMCLYCYDLYFCYNYCHYFFF